MPGRRIEVEIIGSEKSLQAALGRSGVALGGFQKKLDSSSRRMVSTGMTLNRQLTLPLLAVAGASAKLALDYGTAMNHVQALTGASEKQTQQWSDELLKLGPKVAQTPQQLAETLYFVASSGAKVNQVLPITAASAKLAAAGMGDAQTVAQLLTSAVNAYGPKALSAAKASNVLTEAIKVGKAEPADLATSLGRVIPVAQATGVSFAEVAASVAELTNTGLSADQAVTGVRAILTTLIKPTSGAAKELHHLGFTVDDLQRSVKQKGLLVTMRELAKGLDGNQRAAGKLFPNVRALTAFLALTGKNAGNAAHAVDLVTHSAGAANKAFQTASHSARFQLNQSLSEIEANGIKLGNTLLPAIGRVSADVAGLASGFSHLSTTEQDAILAIAGGAVALGPVLTIMGNLGKVTSLLISGAQGLAGAFAAEAGPVNAAGVAMTDLRTAMAGGEIAAVGLAGPVAALVGAAALGGLIVAATVGASKTDVLAGSFRNAMNAADGLSAAIHGAASATQAASSADHQRTAAALAVKVAQQQVNTLYKTGKKGTLEYKQAVNQLQIAQDQYRPAAAGAALAEDNARKARQRANRTYSEAKDALGQLTKATRIHVRAEEQNTSKMLRGQGLLKNYADASTTAGKTVQNFAHKASALAGSLDQQAAKLQAGNPIMASNVRHMAIVAQEAARLARAIGRIPSYKEIQIALRINQYGSANVNVGNPAAGGGTAGNPHGTGHRAGGGPVYSGGAYIVGESGPETLVMDRGASGRVLPYGSDLGPVEFVMTNWHEGRGYFRQIAGGVTARHAHRVAQLDRMGA